MQVRKAATDILNENATFVSRRLVENSHNQLELLQWLVGQQAGLGPAHQDIAGDQRVNQHER
ncbi:hypothetical protein [Bradyrhizobium diazoefficiens]